MQTKTDYDVAIIGGGLAGLAASILLARRGHRVVLFEKERYPFHRVCGEYISLESWDFLRSLGLPLEDLHLPRIDTLHLSAPNGREVKATLPLGGFGISRYKLDAMLCEAAVRNGVKVRQQTKVDGVCREQDLFQISIAGERVTARLCCAAFGKRSNLDVKWNRPFVQAKSTRLNNYIGIKYHVRINRPANVIALHNFRDGYCGLSQVEDETHCLCYLTKAENLKESGGNIERLQAEILCRNPFLRTIFREAEIVPQFPVTISQISFQTKEKVENGILMLGDAAGMITPLCGNGMSIALHTAKLAANLMLAFLAGNLSREQLEAGYSREWKNHFASRLRTGRIIQRFFGSEGLSNALVGTVRTFPFLARPLIRMTHGKPF